MDQLGSDDRLGRFLLLSSMYVEPSHHRSLLTFRSDKGNLRTRHPARQIREKAQRNR
jgi:hypothetical protein